MSQTWLVARLALRELWMSFRLFVLLAAYLGAGVLIASVPGTDAETLERLTLAFAVATVVGAATAAWSLSHERELGRIGWLAARSIERRRILTGWFVALGALTVGGTVGTAVLGWAASGGSVERVSPIAFGWTIVAVACAATALLALGLLVGAWLPPRLASIGAIVVGGLVIGAGWAAPWWPALPVKALAELPQLDRPISLAMQGAGLMLAVAVLFLVMASIVLGRADL